MNMHLLTIGNFFFGSSFFPSTSLFSSFPPLGVVTVTVGTDVNDSSVGLLSLEVGVGGWPKVSRLCFFDVDGIGAETVDDRGG